MIERIEKLGPELHLFPFGKQKRLEQAEIPVIDARTAQKIAAEIAPRIRNGGDGRRVEPMVTRLLKTAREQLLSRRKARSLRAASNIGDVEGRHDREGCAA